MDTRYHNQLSQIFSNSFISNAITNDYKFQLKNLFEISGFKILKSKTVQDSLSTLYKYLASNYRTEYVYKNTIANEIHLLKHDLNNSTLLTEFRSNTSKADVVIVNGTTSVYEIKTELDSLDKLPNQLNSYSKLFDKIYVVIHEKFLRKVLDISDKNVGIILLDNNLNLIEIRKSKSNKINLDPNTVFDSLRKDEYLSIIKRHYGYLPEVPNTLINKECRKLFLLIPIKKVHVYFVGILKERKISSYQIDLIKTVHSSLTVLLLQKKFSATECEKIKLYLDSKI